MFNLNSDMIRHIGLHLDFQDLLNFSIINADTYKIFDDQFYRQYAIQLYSKEFWDKALSRPKKYSRPLSSMKKELIRIEEFQNGILLIDGKKFSNQDFYNLWKAIDDLK
tara:strand:- start:1185 stop:1511 length:327 start_codon:yes stop_codon:yes gene_type:complete